MLMMSLLRGHVVFIILNIYIFGYKVRIKSSQVAVYGSAWKYCESLTPYVSTIANGKFLLWKFSCLSVRYNLKTLWALSLPTLVLFSAKLEALHDTKINKKQSLKDTCFYQVAGWEKACFLVSFFCDTKLDVEKTSYLAKVAYSKRNG